MPLAIVKRGPSLKHGSLQGGATVIRQKGHDQDGIAAWLIDEPVTASPDVFQGRFLDPWTQGVPDPYEGSTPIMQSLLVL
jgi:hypothetical protein